MAKLSDIKNQNPFRTPDDYFDDFQRDIETRIAEEHIRNLCGRENPFVVPAHYFEMTSNNLRPKHKPKIFSILKPIFAAAAALIFGLLIWNITVSKTEQLITTAHIEVSDYKLNIKSEFIIDQELQDVIIEEYLADVDENLVAEYFNEEDSVFGTEHTETTDDEIVEYLTDYLAYSEIEDGF